MTDTATRADPRSRASAGPGPAEYLAGREILAAAGLLAAVRFAYYGLEEPPKADVLAGRPARTAGCARS